MQKNIRCDLFLVAFRLAKFYAHATLTDLIQEVEVEVATTNSK